MITYKTLEVYLEKVVAALGDVDARIAEYELVLVGLKEQKIAINAQIETLKQLMNVEENPPTVELPFAGPENIEDRFNHRFDTHETSPEETYLSRQENVYRPEAMETVETLDEANRAKSEAE